jgi:hypothetical protein
VNLSLALRLRARDKLESNLCPPAFRVVVCKSSLSNVSRGEDWRVHQAHFIFNQPQRTQQERTFTPNGTPVISPVATRASVAPSAVERLLIRPFCAEYVYDHRWWNFSGFCLKAVCSPKSRRAAAAAAPRHRAQWALRFQGAVIFQQCLRAGLRGHRFSSYRAGRSAHWLKVKKPGIAGGAAARLINIGSCRSGNVTAQTFARPAFSPLDKHAVSTRKAFCGLEHRPPRTSYWLPLLGSAY